MWIESTYQSSRTCTTKPFRPALGMAPVCDEIYGRALVDGLPAGDRIASAGTLRPRWVLRRFPGLIQNQPRPSLTTASCIGSNPIDPALPTSAVICSAD